MTKGKRGRLCGSAGGEMVMKAVLEGGGWEMSPPPSNKQPLEERNGAALFGGGGGIVHSPSSTRNKQSSSEMPEGSPPTAQHVSTVRTYMLPEAFLWRASIFPSRGRYMAHRKVSFAQAPTY